MKFESFDVAFELIFCEISCFVLCAFGIWIFLWVDLFQTFESRANFIDSSFLTVYTMGEMKFLSKHE